MDADREQLNGVSRGIIGCAFTVLNTLGPGFLEKVYENALAFELRDAGYKVVQQAGFTVRYRGAVVGSYYPDLMVEESVLVELKNASAFDESHRVQCINYLKASGLHLCLLLNFFRPRLGIERVVNNL